MSKRRRRKDGTELPKFASGLADTNLGSNGSALLKPTPILTPEVIKPNHDNQIRKSSNDSYSSEEQPSETFSGNEEHLKQTNSNSTILLSTETSKTKQNLDGLLDSNGLNNEISQVRNLNLNISL